VITAELAEAMLGYGMKSMGNGAARHHSIGGLSLDLVEKDDRLSSSSS